jgi:hypothetical protein
MSHFIAIPSSSGRRDVGITRPIQLTGTILKITSQISSAYPTNILEFELHTLSSSLKSVLHIWFFLDPSTLSSPSCHTSENHNHKEFGLVASPSGVERVFSQGFSVLGLNLKFPNVQIDTDELTCLYLQMNSLIRMK